MADPVTPPRWHSIACVCVFALICVAIFGPVVLDRERALSHITGDTSQFFFSMREFGAEEIRAGRLPLWNPYLMSGTPFVGNFQSALFYPPNAIYLALPLEMAADLDYALHTFFGGLFMFLWARQRRISPQGALLAAAMAVFGSTFTLRMLGGQLTMVDAMAWAPLVFLAAERIYDASAERRSLLGPVLLGAAATGLQILAGHPQTVFITGFCVGLYCLVRLPGAARRLHAIAALGAMAVWGVLLSAVQLLPGLHTMSESVRTAGKDSEFATTFSFPPENLLTLIAPAFFGDRVYRPYWGQWAWWDSALFFGVVGLALAIYGTKHAPAAQRRYTPFLVLLILFLAMGRYTPVYGVFATIPIFDVLRGVSKFLFVGTFLAALLAGMGYDRLAAQEPRDGGRRGALVTLALMPAIALGGLAIGMAAFTDGGAAWRDFMFRQLADSLYFTMWFDPPGGFFEGAVIESLISLGIAFVTMGLIALCFWRAGRSRAAAHVLLALGVFEVAAFAFVYRDTFAVRDMRPAAWVDWYETHRGDHRVIQLRGPDTAYARNLPMDERQPAVWGYEPVMLHRHAWLVASASGQRPERLNAMLDHVRWGSDVIEFALNAQLLEVDFDEATGTADLPAEFDLLRCRYVIVPTGLPNTPEGIFENPNPLPRFLLVRNYSVIKDPRVALQALAEPIFNPYTTVLLEDEPVPAPDPAAGAPAAEVVVEDESGDHVTLRVTLDTPAILVMTDPYSTGWTVKALEGSAQQEYRIVPGDYALRALPLDAGAHHFRMEYRPRAFDIGLTITMAALIAFGAAFGFAGVRSLGVTARRRRRSSRRPRRRAIRLRRR